MGNHLFAKRGVLFSLIFFFTVLLQPLGAQKTRALQNKEVIVLFEEPLQFAAEEVINIYSVVKKELEKTFGWRVDFRPTVFLIKDSGTFQRVAGSDLIVAFANAQRNHIVIDYSKMKVHPFTVEITLKHELCHLLLHHHIERENLPRWLDEGIAQWVSGGIAEIIMNQKRSILDEATLTGRYIRIRALTKRFPQERKSLFLAYEESKSLVEYMVANFGRDGILAVLTHLRDGEKVDTALLKGLSISFDELERKWKNHLRKRITWLTYLINYLYEILFFLAALTMIYGFIRVWIKKRRYRDDEED
ncbi:MAG: peptidase MA family metallohydrolase [Desulfatiglandales bacterium]